MLMSGGLYATRGGDWYNTSVFFRLMVRLEFLAASEKWLTMCCRASSVCVRRAQSSSNSSSEFLDGFHACDEMPKVEETAICSETGVDATWQVLFCLMEHDAEEDGAQCGGWDAIEDAEAA